MPVVFTPTGLRRLGRVTPMPNETTIKATIATLTAAGLDVTLTTVAGVAEVVVTDATTGERYVVRDRN